MTKENTRCKQFVTYGVINLVEMKKNNVKSENIVLIQEITTFCPFNMQSSMQRKKLYFNHSPKCINIR